MSVLVEAFSVIILHKAVQERFEGGLDGFARIIPNQTYCTDEELIRIGFMREADALAFMEALIQNNLQPPKNNEAADFTLVDQNNGILIPTPWASFDIIHKFETETSPEIIVSACSLRGQQNDGRLAIPVGWEYKGSLSDTGKRSDGHNLDVNMKFIRHENGLDIFLDQSTGKEMYVGCPESPLGVNTISEKTFKIKNPSSNLIKLRFGKVLLAVTYILLLMNALVFIGTVVELMNNWLGSIGYVLWVVAAPILSPAILALPWFESFVSGDPVSDRLLVVWLAWILCLAVRAVTWKWAPDK